MDNTSVQQIKERLDIVELISSYIKLEKAGANFRACCPFHSEKKPSFFVSPARQIFKCFGCNESGDIFSFVMKIEGVEFGDALRILAQRAGVELKTFSPELKTQRQRLYEINDLASRFFEAQLQKSVNGKLAQSYLLKRGLIVETIKKWRLGYSPDSWRSLFDFLVSKGFQKEEIMGCGLAIESEKSRTPFDRFRNRIMFPISDLNSQVVGFGGRIFDQIEGKTQKKEDAAKYVNTPNTLLYDKSQILYGLNFGKIALRQKNFCILTEGYMDVILSHQASFENTVAASGTALTPFQLKIIKRYTSNLFSAFDMDNAGGMATNRGIDLAQKEDFNIKVICMTRGADPADIISGDIKDWENAVAQAKDIMDFYFETAIEKFDKETVQGKREIAKFFLPLLKKIPDKIIVSHWAQKLAQVLEVSENSVVEEMAKIKTPAIFSAENSFSVKQNNSFTETISFPGNSVFGGANKKSRRQLLEERILTLILRNFQHLALIEKEKLDFFSPLTREIISNLLIESPGDNDSFNLCLRKIEARSQEVKDLLTNLSFLTESEDQTNFSSSFAPQKEDFFEEEIRLCLYHLCDLSLRNRFEELTREMQNAEVGGDQELLERLMAEFNRLSKSASLR